MALHIPIVTTKMNECLKYKSVLIAENHQDFLQKLILAYEKKEDKKYMALLDKEAKDNSWDKKADSLINHLKSEESELL